MFPISPTARHQSDVKTVAVANGEVLDSAETEWDVTNPDPQYHYDLIVKAMKATAAKLPGPVEAIGGSATGAVSANSEATWCDCFPNVPPDVYKEPHFARRARHSALSPQRPMPHLGVRTMSAPDRLKFRPMSTPDRP